MEFGSECGEIWLSHWLEDMVGVGGRVNNYPCATSSHLPLFRHTKPHHPLNQPEVTDDIKVKQLIGTKNDYSFELQSSSEGAYSLLTLRCRQLPAPRITQTNYVDFLRQLFYAI